MYICIHKKLLKYSVSKVSTCRNHSPVGLSFSLGIMSENMWKYNLLKISSLATHHIKIELFKWEYISLWYLPHQYFLSISNIYTSHHEYTYTVGTCTISKGAFTCVKLLLVQVASTPTSSTYMLLYSTPQEWGGGTQVLNGYPLPNDCADWKWLTLNFKGCQLVLRGKKGVGQLQTKNLMGV